eukprot:COSAG05_NODE_2538_length_2931_cov_3.885593_3_plen_116_part_00
MAAARSRVGFTLRRRFALAWISSAHAASIGISAFAHSGAHLVGIPPLQSPGFWQHAGSKVAAQFWNSVIDLHVAQCEFLVSGEGIGAASAGPHWMSSHRCQSLAVGLCASFVSTY